MVQQQLSVPRPPAFVRLVDPLVRRLLGIGFPMGPNTLLTVRGRKSGEPRRAGVAVVLIDGRRWVVGAYGDVHWVRNLRAAGEATIRVKGNGRQVRAVALSEEEAETFFRDILVPYARGLPLPARIATSVFAREILADPVGAASTHPVFELHELPGG